MSSIRMATEIALVFVVQWLGGRGYQVMLHSVDKERQLQPSRGPLRCTRPWYWSVVTEVYRYVNVRRAYPDLRHHVLMDSRASFDAFAGSNPNTKFWSQRNPFVNVVPGTAVNS